MSVYSGGLHDHINADIVNPDALPLAKELPWSINMYIYVDYVPESLTMLFNMGGYTTGTGRYIGKIGDNVRFWGGDNLDVSSSTPYRYGHWQMITVTYNGDVMKMYQDGVLIGTNDNPSNIADCEAYVALGDRAPWGGGKYGAGTYDNVSIYNGVLNRSEILAMVAELPAEGDFNTDDTVDVADMATFAGYWLVEGDVVCPADFTGDSNVTLDDFAVIANNWLTTK